MSKNIFEKKDSWTGPIILLGVLVLFGVFMITSCNPVKQVLKDPEKKDFVGREWEKDNPCVVDSIVTVKSDTLTKLDTLYNILTDTIIVDGKEKTIIKYIPEIVVKTVTIRDSVKTDKSDLRRLNIALDSVNHYKGLSQQFKAKYEQQITETAAQRARGNKWILYFILLCVATALSHYLRSKFNSLFKE